jgi:UDPglucose 6-dehydrogenase
MTASVNITVVGSGYVGLVAAVCFAELGHIVTCVDNDEARVAALNNGVTPIHERFLPELLDRHRHRDLQFTTDLSAAAQDAEAIFIAVGTPQSESGEADMSYVEAVAVEIARSLNRYTVLVEKSTVPVYTSDWITRVMDRQGIDPSSFAVASNPEFLREGTAVSDFLHPDRIVIGADGAQAAALLTRIYRPLTSGAYYAADSFIPGRRSASDPPPLLHVSNKSAEIIKHASNAFLAMKISFINAVANLCEAVDANIEHVSQGIGADRRIGPQFLRPGIGYGGSCFPKDVAAFRAIAAELGVDLGLLAEVEKINTGQQRRFFAKVRGALWTLRGKRLAVLGLAYKGETDDIRESPAIDLVNMFLAEGCCIAAYDPAAMERAAQANPPSSQLRYATSEYDAAENADALLILTDWPQFASLDLSRLHAALRYPIIVDGRNLYKPQTMTDRGFTYISIGRTPAQPAREMARNERPQ